MSDNTILPCPFCGGLPYKSNGLYRSDNDDYNWVQCLKCHASIARKGLQDVANQAWNTRHESGWIKCSEQLSPISVRVLIYIPEIGVTSAYLENNNSYRCDALLTIPLYKVTHWRELPPPPMEDGK